MNARAKYAAHRPPSRAIMIYAVTRVIFSSGFIFFWIPTSGKAQVPVQRKTEPATPRTGPVILLVHGVVVDPNQPSAAFGKVRTAPGGREWDGLIGYLNAQGLRFGGVISPSPRNSATDLP